jgi:hypothetical protein
LAMASGASWCTLINDTDLYIETDEIKRYDEHEKQFYMTFYTPAQMERLFPSAAVLPPDYKAYPASSETVMHHCCVIRTCDEIGAAVK